MILRYSGCTDVHCTPMYIAHLDADCFYVSCERIRYAGLREKPVGVLGNQGACVIAKSYELRAHGVKTGEAIWDAQKRCPHAIYVKRDFHWYEEISRRILALLRTVSEAVEYYSVDEFFFDASYLPRAFNTDMAGAALALQARILVEIGVPVSVGVARTKALAKLASESTKPFGSTVALSDDERMALLIDRPVDAITGIAKKSSEKLGREGITTCEQYTMADRKTIRRILTKKGEDLWWELNGTPISPLLTQRPHHKNIARGGSLGGGTDDLVKRRAWVARNTERLMEALDANEIYCERLALYLGFKEGHGTFGRAELMEPSAQMEELLPVGYDLLDEAWSRRKGKVNYMHVFAEVLQFRTCYQPSLFSRHDPSKLDTASILRLVNAKSGRFALRSGATLPLKETYDDKAQSYDICDIQGKICF